MFIASILRFAGAFVILGAISYGIYAVIFDSITTGAVWIVGSLVVGWAANHLFGLVTVLSSTLASPTIRD
jgi:hypothetical protein